MLAAGLPQAEVLATGLPQAEELAAGQGQAREVAVGLEQAAAGEGQLQQPYLPQPASQKKENIITFRPQFKMRMIMFVKKMHL